MGTRQVLQALRPSGTCRAWQALLPATRDVWLSFQGPSAHPELPAGSDNDDAPDRGRVCTTQETWRACRPSDAPASISLPANRLVW